MRKYNYSVISKNLFDIDRPTEHATIAILGISPGPSQFKAQEEIPDIKERNKFCAFKGAMRTNLESMLDKTLKIEEIPGVPCCKSLWGKNHDKALLTSILPSSVVRFDGDIPDELSESLEQVESYESEYKDKHNGKSSGFFIGGITYYQIKKHDVLRNEFNTFIKRIKSNKNLKLIVVLGKAYDVIKKAIDAKELDINEDIIINIPHASGANGGQIAGFIDAANDGIETSEMTEQKRKGYRMYREALKSIEVLKGNKSEYNYKNNK